MKRVKLLFGGEPGKVQLINRRSGYPAFGGRDFPDQDAARDYVEDGNKKTGEVVFSLPKIKTGATDRRLRGGVER